MSKTCWTNKIIFELIRFLVLIGFECCLFFANFFVLARRANTTRNSSPWWRKILV